MLDLDVNDDRVHRSQMGRLFHGHYDHYIFAADHLLCARLRTADRDGAHGSVEELERLVPRLREAWQDTRIIIRGGSAFCWEWLMSWCERQGGVHFVLGLARNERLVRRVQPELGAMQLQSVQTGLSARTFRT